MRIKLYNKVPESIKTKKKEKNFKLLKKELKSLLLSQSLSSVDEFLQL